MKTTEKQRQSAMTTYRKRVASGICVYCPNKAESPHIRCAICREITADYCAGRRDIWKLKGLCGRCGKEKASAGFVTCEKCRLKQRKPKKGKIQFPLLNY